MLLRVGIKCNARKCLCYTGWSKSLCAPDDYSTIIRCTEAFWSFCRKGVTYLPCT